MVYVNAQACIAAHLVFFVLGLWAAMAAGCYVRMRAYRNLFWLIPGVIAAAWLESSFNSSIIHQPAISSLRAPELWRSIFVDLIGWLVAAAFYPLLRDAKPLIRWGR